MRTFYGTGVRMDKETAPKSQILACVMHGAHS